MKKLYRHGDVDIREIESIPKEAIDLKENILARGEFTGHNHAVFKKNGNGIAVLEKSGVKYFEIKEPGCYVTHPEHGTKPIEIGKYMIEIEREYDPFEKKLREVRD